ncbi:Ig-like domain-containing protein [Sphingobacterium sp. lm-10]|uniref:Ig-like domain-containing protein n=1 Tax=Sphingobacterium sp. lm-10 TaxID=2944904 RepID=UPI0020228262|nr:Ig-like domain-containing protein [Sphingobacterium sp. lm-10]MCL7987754.1 Ig-like domain-containing protein [Sphingobacterium sp. lm-10]
MTNLFKTSTLLLVCFLQFGCSKDDPKPIPELNITEATIKFDEDVKFGVANFSNVEWSSSDEFVGGINIYGIFSGRHVGEATVTALVDGYTLTAKVVVEPSVTSFEEPLINFGADVQTIKDHEKRNAYIENSAYIIYNGRGTHENHLTYYTFNGQMTGAIITFNNGQSIIQDAVKFYTERYRYLGRLENGRIYYESADGSYRVFIGQNYASYTKDPYPGT